MRDDGSTRPDDSLDDLPPSAKFVHYVLDADGPLTQQEITEETRLIGRTVRYALNRLADVGLIVDRPSTKDARQSLYDVVE